MRLYWISWQQPTDDYRPLTYPPNESVLGWWCTGYDSKDRATLCAWVCAETVEGARAAVSKDWPEAVHGRFCEESQHVTLSGRFPQSDWMVPRLAPWWKPQEIEIEAGT